MTEVEKNVDNEASEEDEDEDGSEEKNKQRNKSYMVHEFRDTIASPLLKLIKIIYLNEFKQHYVPVLQIKKAGRKTGF